MARPVVIGEVLVFCLGLEGIGECMPFCLHILIDRILARVGALITLVSLILDTSSQQLIQLATIAAPDGHNFSLAPGNIPRTETYRRSQGKWEHPAWQCH